ncbi:hypothetical protein DQ04_10501020 [Trypanosoma grayi]|uniref:hypothetical protein n=1 Tax=Trypanosoma grayi TaxID=71804 RepID=UPI0004F48085|nr:hypothetical protein DQ04_10501020 [Trypanosoma grayi]KEG07228.1 hypothetical protein DQ04_10501020 [Trypanosoma grayi]
MVAARRVMCVWALALCWASFCVAAQETVEAKMCGDKRLKENEECQKGVVVTKSSENEPDPKDESKGQEMSAQEDRDGSGEVDRNGEACPTKTPSPTGPKCTTQRIEENRQDQIQEGSRISGLPSGSDKLSTEDFSETDVDSIPECPEGREAQRPVFKDKTCVPKGQPGKVSKEPQKGIDGKDVTTTPDRGSHLNPAPPRDGPNGGPKTVGSSLGGHMGAVTVQTGHGAGASNRASAPPPAGSPAKTDQAASGSSSEKSALASSPAVAGTQQSPPDGGGDAQTESSSNKAAVTLKETTPIEEEIKKEAPDTTQVSSTTTNPEASAAGVKQPEADASTATKTDATTATMAAAPLLVAALASIAVLQAVW